MVYTSSPNIKWSKNLYYLDVVLCNFLIPTRNYLLDLLSFDISCFPQVIMVKFFITVGNNIYYFNKSTVHYLDKQIHSYSYEENLRKGLGKTVYEFRNLYTLGIHFEAGISVEDVIVIGGL